MLQIGSRVYHQKLRANGIIEEVDETKSRDKYRVRFFWAKYCKDIRHGSWSDRPERGDKWQWCEEQYLVETPWYIRGQFFNKITSIGGRSLDRLIRRVCEFPRRKINDDSDIIIVYGQSNHSLPSGIPLVLNRKLIPDKYIQMQILEEPLALMSCYTRPGEPDPAEWIIKPAYSMGGRGIRMDDGNGLRPGEYYQRKFAKVREFRAHCFLWMNEPVTFIQEKFISDKSQLTWNKKQGGKFRFSYQEGMPNFQNLQYSSFIGLTDINMIKKVAVAALKAIHYDFGGVDLGMDKFGNLKVFEVNSRMGLLEQSLFTYKRAFTKLRTLDIDRYKEERWR